MQEYRRAYQRMQEGRLRILVFVRRSIWNVQEDRKALSNFLRENFVKEQELSESDADKIKNHASKVINDAETLFQFLNEVRRHDEMSDDGSTEDQRPKGNWVHSFENFQEIVQVFSRQFRLGKPLRIAVTAANLKAEIVSNLQQLLERGKKDPTGLQGHNAAASSAVKHLKGDLLDYSEIPNESVILLAYFVLGCTNISHRLRTLALDEAINSGHFFEFDTVQSAPIVGVLQQALLQLRQAMTDLARSERGFLVKDKRHFINISRSANKDRAETTQIQNQLLVPCLHMSDRQKDIIDLSSAIHEALEGDFDALKTFTPQPTNPIASHAKAIADERPSLDEVAAWIQSGGRK